MCCCSGCSRNPQEAIESRVMTLGETFLREYVQVSNESKVEGLLPSFFSRSFFIWTVCSFSWRNSLAYERANKLRHFLKHSPQKSFYYIFLMSYLSAVRETYFQSSVKYVFFLSSHPRTDQNLPVQPKSLPQRGLNLQRFFTTR